MTITTRNRARQLIVFATCAIGLATASCGDDSSPVDVGPTTPTHAVAATTTTVAVAASESGQPASTNPPPTTPSVPTSSADTMTSQHRPTATIDELVEVGGARMHVRCTGDGQTTVLMIAGFTADLTTYAGIEPSVAERSRVCSYDRFGTGSSDPPAAPQTFSSQASDLRQLLAAIGEPGPFVVVGHSFGGDVAVTFTSMYAADVSGLLLLEASPSTWNSTVCSVIDDGSAGAAIWLQTCSMQADPINNVEGLAGPAAFAELSQIGSLGSVPMIVVTESGHDYTADGFDPETAHRLTAAWFDGQEHWASLSSDSDLIHVDNSGHNVHLDQPALVIAQIARLVDGSAGTS